MTKVDYNKKRSSERKQVLVAINHGLAMPIETGVMIKLFESIHTEVSPELEAIKKAQDYVDAGYKSQLENSPELYGREIDFGTGYKLHSPSGSCDVETSETERALIACTSRNESVEQPLASAVRFYTSTFNTK